MLPKAFYLVPILFGKPLNEEFDLIVWIIIIAYYFTDWTESLALNISSFGVFFFLMFPVFMGKETVGRGDEICHSFGANEGWVWLEIS